MEKKFASNLGLVILSTIFAVYTFNCFLGLYEYFYLQRMNVNYLHHKQAVAIGKSWDDRTPPKVIQDFRKDGVDANFAFTPQLWKHNPSFFPLAGKSLSFTVLGNEDGSYSSYISDRYGFNNPDASYQKKIKIMLLGDSYAHGCCVDQQKTVAGHLRAKGVNTVSLGLSNSGFISYLAVAREYLRAVKPEQVVLLYYSNNDFSDTENESKTLLVKYLDQGFTQSLPKKQQMIDSLASQYTEELLNRGFNERMDLSVFLPSDHPSLQYWRNTFRSMLKGLLTLSPVRSRIRQALSKNEYPKTIAEDLHQEDLNTSKVIYSALERLSKETAAQGTTLTVIHITNSKHLNSRQFGQIHWVHDACAKLGIKFRDFGPVYFSLPQSVMHDNNGDTTHYGVNGYDILSKFIVDTVI